MNTNISTKYNKINPVNNVITKTGKIVIRNVPIGIIRALRFQSEKSGDSKRDMGSVGFESYKAIKYYLSNAKKINVANIEKSCL
jgi:hypothetical protein